MSDFSVLSQEYEHASNLSRDLNRALILLKKLSLGVQGAERITPEQIAESCRLLRSTLELVIEVLETDLPRSVDSNALRVIPGALLARLRTQHPAGFDAYRDDLRRISTLLRTDGSRLSREDLAVLDILAAAVDAERSSVFKQMTRC